ncbi:uncharacterized protein LOC129943767 [Eupeodes corollae]|uniref:uncharacterized protein LOC129943767 n=1 Tax=Eupeodes corollae TaxID=290404 RepID=UPI00249003B4|nr:uncharacterized protein LOC129943767 [Eupeodes corollae]
MFDSGNACGGGTLNLSASIYVRIIVFQISGANVKLKWKNLKDTFRRVLRKAPRPVSGSEAPPTKPKWPFFEMMAFTRQTIEPDPTEGNLREPESYSMAQNRFFAETISDLLEEEDVTLSSVNMLTNSTPSTSTSCPQNVRKNKNKRASTYNLESEFLELEKERLQILKKEVAKKEEDSDDLQFFKSLLPFMAQFNNFEKLEIRTDIQNIILDKLKNTNKD